MDVLLYSPENARNLGNIVRTSAAFGLRKIHIHDEFKLLELKLDAIRETSMGHEVEVELVNVTDVEEFSGQYDNKFITTLAKGSKRIGDPEYAVNFPEDSLILFGNETRGLPRKYGRKNGFQKIVIPTRGMSHCLSLPVSYGIVLYEFFRQHPQLFPERGK